MKYEEIKLNKKESPSMLFLTGASIIFPSSVIFWILNYFFKFISSVDSEIDLENGIDQVTPVRWLFSVGISLSITIYGLRKKSLSLSGGLAAFVVGFFCTMSNYCFMVSLLAFFLSSSRATKFRQHLKKKFEEDFKEGGQRNWIQVICNGGMATELSILYLVDIGYGERPIDFITDYRATWLSIALLGSLSCANGDTWASELGTVVSIISSEPRLITTFKKVPKGTNGGVTLGGLLFSFLGGIFVGLFYYLALLLTVDSAILLRSPSQTPIILIGGLGGLLGSIIDSLLGATLQFSGIDANGKIHEVPGPKIKPISGLCALDNHSINLISTILTGLFLPSIALNFI